MKFWIAFGAGLLLSAACKNHGYLGKVECPTKNVNDSLFVEIHYRYGFIVERSRDEIPQETLKRLDSLYTFTTTVSGHEGWAVNGGKKYNEYYQPEYFVVQNPNAFEGKSRNDHDFSLFCPNKQSEMVRLFVDNDLNTSIRELTVSVKPFRYFYNRRTDQYEALLHIQSMDTNYFHLPKE
jgi:hypothetical protein